LVLSMIASRRTAKDLQRGRTKESWGFEEGSLSDRPNLK
jgi:hypothetical protein